MKVYTLENPDDVDKMIFAIKSTFSEVKITVGLKEALTSKQHRFSSWNGLILALFQQFTGISAVLLFQTKIF